MDRFTAQWRDAVVGPELAELGLERPEQLGALFIGDGEFIARLTEGALPVTDDRPRRIAAARENDFSGWLDTAAAAERFVESPLIERLWPAALRSGTLPYFAHQGLINRVIFAERTNLDAVIEGLHAVLTETDLRAPVLWALGGDADALRRAEQSGEEARRLPDIRALAGVGLLAERRYGEAAEAFRDAEADTGAGAERHRRRDAFRLRIYAMCLAGREDEAGRLAAARYAEKGAPDPLPPFWAWMDRTFGVDAAAERLTLSDLNSPAPARSSGR
jgi:hypothetical protein